MASAVSSQVSGPFWRAAGMTYVAYVNTCASLVRTCLKEPHKTQAAQREQVYYKVAMWEDGRPQKAGRFTRAYERKKVRERERHCHVLVHFYSFVMVF